MTALAAATVLSLKPVASSLRAVSSDAQSLRIVDRNGLPLTVTYQSRWNSNDIVALHDVPSLMRDAFILSEDRRFYDHGGVDWRARIGAITQNIKNGSTVRGASTITEQVVRMIHPRPRNPWSKWVEGWEAAMLERSAGKADILEFYMNQVPYASNRRGVIQAARYYFGRDLSTLSGREMLALVVMARAPSAYDLYRYPARVNGGIGRLAGALARQGLIDDERKLQILGERFVLAEPLPGVDARHFARHVRLTMPPEAGRGGSVRTTLDAGLQAQVQDILNQRVRALTRKNVHNGAALVVDHHTGEILAWAVAGAGESGEGMKTPAADVDAVVTPRQPGSSMKPFLYGLALEKGWTAATLIDDSPLAEAIGTGLHRFRNYSNVYYGPITLREALGNSLNIPALRAVQYVGPGHYLTALQSLGFSSLNKSSAIYDDGLALGAGEVSLLELVQGYTALANKGVFRTLKVLPGSDFQGESRRVYSAEVASLISSILSDPQARLREFGAGSVLNLPIQTAAKTGTSTNYRDAWVAGFNDRYVVGIWMGNLDNTPTFGVTGSTGPALAMRSIFDRLNKGRQTQPLYLSPRLVTHDICSRPAQKAGESCPRRTEWFIAGTEPADVAAALPRRGVELVRPTEGLQMAVDPRVPKPYQNFRFELAGLSSGDKVSWIVDGDVVARTEEPRYLWPLERGRHSLSVLIEGKESKDLRIPEVNFLVK